MRFYQSLRIPLKIIEVDGGYIIGFKHTSVAGTVAHNAIHNDNYVFVVYPSKEQAKAAAEHIMALRKIPLINRIVVE